MIGSARDWLQLGKVRIQILATASALACYWIGGRGAWDWLEALHLVIGLTLVSTASATINQILEVDVDRRMHRTQGRPLPAGRVSVRAATHVSWIAALVGMAWLLVFLNPLTAWLALVMLSLYDFVYTPLKGMTPLNTVVGAVPGALPLLVGYAAAGNGLDALAGVLFLILFLWQFPHFFAIAWLHREDYRRGGLIMLPGVDESGAASGRQSVQYAILLVPASLLPYVFDVAGRVYFYGAFSLSIAFLITVIFFGLRRGDRRARIVLRASIVYLPLLFVLLLVDARV